MRRDLIPTLLLCLSAAVPCTHAQTVVYVDADAVGANDGSSWANARIDLQIALGSAVPGDEFWVANGTYKPTAVLDRGVSFSLASGVGILGGFEGVDSINFPGGETQREQRNTDPATNGTVLSGDIGSPGDNSDNSFHVVTGGGTDATAVLDGFTITEGNADGSSALLDDSGGGIFNLAGSPSVANCLITGNTALRSGGGMFTGTVAPMSVSSPELINCTFSGNSCIGSGLSGGGGLCNGNFDPTAASTVSLTDCTFSDNSAISSPGGGMIDISANSTLTNCNFIGNTAPVWGGGLSNWHGVPGTSYSMQRLINCTFVGNTSGNKGGGVFNHLAASVVLTNCTFRGNIASTGGGGGLFNRHVSTAQLTNCTFIANEANTISGGGAIKSGGSTTVELTNCTFSGNSATANGGAVRNSSTSAVTLTNCILWGNTDDSGTGQSAQISHGSTVPLVVNHTLVQGLTGGFGGTGNIDADPLFVDADGTDDIPGTDDDDLRLLIGSPAIDAGDNLAVPPDLFDLDDDLDTAEPLPIDLDGNPRFQGVGAEPIVDLGAYEFQDQPSTVEEVGEALEDSATEEFTDAIDEILSNPEIPDSAADSVQDALDEVIGNEGGSANNGAADKLQGGDLIAGLTKLRKAILDLQAAADNGFDTTVLQALLADFAAQAVEIAIADAAAEFGEMDPGVQAAQLLFDAGVIDQDLGNFIAALDLFKMAVQVLP